MKKIVLFILIILILASCSVKTNEEKARELIEPQVKSSLIKPESYEFAQMQLDSCFSDSQQNPEVIAFALKVAKLFNEYKGYASDAERAESSMTIYAPSYGYQSAHSAQQQKKYKAEMEKARRKAADTKDQIIQLYKDNKALFTAFQSGKHEFIGWMAVFGYRAETAGGMKTMGEGLFYLNKDLSEITARFTKEDMIEMESADLDDLKYEFEDELKYFFNE
jgi:PBP1b-binding outer membrane lipoprotein LpoB